MQSSDNSSNDSGSNLCGQCGLCCDGTLFVTMKPEKDDRIDHLSLLAVETDADGIRFYRQPCTAHAGHQCSVYHDRPQTCRGYQCKVLQDMQRGNLGQDVAVARVTEARRLAHKVSQDLAVWLDHPLPCAFDTLVSEFNRRWSAMDAIQRKVVNPVMLLEMGAVLVMLAKHFKGDNPQDLAASPDLIQHSQP